MNTIENILTRQSIRKFKDEPISKENIELILKAAMSGPSCVNSRDFSFIVVDDKEVLNKMADANGLPAEPLRNCALGILVCGDLERSFKPAKDYFVVDCSIACQNIILAAHDLGIGSVWLGTYPQMDRVNKQKELFNLPDYIIPHSIIALGYPNENPSLKDKSIEVNRIHYNKW